jgi:hypothetical protein
MVITIIPRGAAARQIPPTGVQLRRHGKGCHLYPITNCRFRFRLTASVVACHRHCYRHFRWRWRSDLRKKEKEFSRQRRRRAARQRRLAAPRSGGIFFNS